MNTANTVYYIGNFDKPEFNAAGKRVYGNALIFEKIGYRVIMVGKSKDKSLVNIPEKYSKSILFYSFPNYQLVNTSAFYKFFEMIVAKEGKPEAIVQYGSPSIALFNRTIINYGKKIGCPVVADVVDWLPPGGSNILFNAIKAIDTYLKNAVFNTKSTGIIAISTYLFNYYKKHGCHNVIIIPPIVEYYKKNTYIRDDNIVNVVYAGVPFRLGRKVNSPKEVKDRLDLAIEGLVGIIDRNFSVLFDIYGITEDEYLTAYPKHKTLINGTKNRVVFHGKQPMAVAQEAINKADFTILLRNVSRATSAGFPTKVVESLACGTPVITTDTSDLRKYINQNENGFYVKIDTPKTNLSKQLAEVISFYIEHKEEIKESCYREQLFVPDRHRDLLLEFLSGIRGME